MARLEFQLRVRPHKVAVLLPWEASTAQCIKAIAMLSKLWGGRYSVLIPVSDKGESQIAETWLKENRPDVVFGLDVDHDRWSNYCQRACQPYAYAPLPENTPALFRESELDLIPAWRLYRQIMQDHPVFEEDKSNVVLVETDETCDLAAYFGATFGTDEKGVIGSLRNAFKAWQRSFQGHVEPAEYVRCCDAMSPRLSLLDLGSYRMDRHVQQGTFLSPSTVVVSSALGADVALFWNLRMSLGPGASGTFLLFPAAAVEDEEAVSALAAWTASGAKHCDYCDVKSLSTDEATLRRLARRLRPRVARRGIKHIDIYWGRMHVPVVLPYDQQACFPVDTEGQVLECMSPFPRFHEFLQSHHSWVVDLVRETGTRRRPLEVMPPPCSTASHVLNAPFPPTMTFVRVPGVRRGPEAISVRSGKRSGSVRWCAPTALELLESILRDAGFSTRKDEKRRAYEAAMVMFGGAIETASACSGVSGQMLLALAEESLTWSQLLHVAKAGKQTQPVGPEVPGLDLIKSRVARRVTKDRFRRYLAEQHPPSEQAADVISYWEKRGVISKQAVLPPCPSCGQRTGLAQLEVAQVVLCPECGNSFRFPEKVDLKYRLSPVVARAIHEGMMPVALTGRFLRLVTKEAFMWLPGVKGVFHKRLTDVDVMACCDGHLALAECKSLTAAATTSRTWTEIVRQLRTLVALARACGAELVFLAFMGTSCASEVTEFAKQNSSEGLRLHVLNGPELQRGWRVREDTGTPMEMPMGLSGFLEPPVRLRPASSPRHGERHLSL